MIRFFSLTVLTCLFLLPLSTIGVAAEIANANGKATAGLPAIPENSVKRCGSCGGGAAPNIGCAIKNISTPQNEGSSQQSRPSQESEFVLDTSTFDDIAFERVIDGQSFVGNGTNIRLWGIEAASQEDTKNLPVQAVTMLEIFLQNAKPLKCKPVLTSHEGENVMRCFIHNIDIAPMLIQEGLVRVRTTESRGLYEDYEEKARNAGTGLWKNNKAAQASANIQSRPMPPQ